MPTELGFIVEGHGEYESILSFISKMIGPRYFPISNAKGIGNIMKNTSDELLKLIKYYQPRKVIITLDFRDALRQGLVNNCIELKETVTANCDKFIDSQKNGSLVLPEEIVVVIAIQTYDSWICADYEALKSNLLINASKITEQYSNVDIEIQNPCKWLESKLKKPVDLKCRAYRKAISKSLRPEIAATKSRSFRKFYKEIMLVSFDN